MIMLSNLLNKDEIYQSFKILIYSTMICLLYYVLSIFMFPTMVPGILEMISCITGLSCVWSVRYQLSLNYIFGIISVICFGIFFWNIGLIGNSLLQLLYFLPIQIYGLYCWTRKSEFSDKTSVTWSTWKQTALYICLIVSFTLGINYILGGMYDNPLISIWDSSIVASSIIAQFLLSHKKIDSWLYWIFPVNISGIMLYYVSGSYLVSILYLMFLVNAIFGIKEWASYNKNT